MQTSFYTPDELKTMGFCSIGEDVLISRKASIYTPELITIGNHVRIDDFCILSGDIKLGSYIHISAYTAIYARFGVELEDFVTISGRVLVYSQNDDYSGEFMTNPMVPIKYTNITGGKVVFKKHSIVASGSIILPDVILGVGSCVGSMSLVKKSIPAWEIHAGIPAIKISDRQQTILELERKIQ